MRDRGMEAAATTPARIINASSCGITVISGTAAIIEARVVQLIFLPPYSPGLNPIEKCWPK